MVSSCPFRKFNYIVYHQFLQVRNQKPCNDMFDPEQFEHLCTIHSLLFTSYTILGNSSWYIKLNRANNNFMFWQYLHTYTDWVHDDTAKTHHFSLNWQNFEKPMLLLTYLVLKLVKHSCKSEIANRFCFWVVWEILSHSFFPDICQENLSAL